MENYYQHLPLPRPQCFRVIHLEPSPDAKSSLCCHLEVASCESKGYDPEYTALSYSWDAQVPSREIECDGRILLITPNCESALRHLRYSKTDRILWIDSICIDQSPEAIDERSQQVNMMGEIYKNASLVVVWLGESDSRTEAAIQQLMDLGAGPVGTGHSNERAPEREFRDRVRRLASKVTKESEDPLGPLFERSWFHRMWTIQEVTLSQLMRVELHCGETVMPWLWVVVAAAILNKEQYRWGRWEDAIKLFQDLSLRLAARRDPGIKKAVDDMPNQDYTTPLLFALLETARKKLSTDPRDKIFALHGVFNELEVPFPAPDYHKSLADVYRDSVITCLNYDKYLHVLYQVPSDHRRDGLASWVPDWSDVGWKNNDPRYAIIRGRFAACGPVNPKWHFSEDQKQLILTGKVFDSVIYRTEPLSYDEELWQYTSDGALGRPSGDPARMQDPAFRERIFDFIHSTSSIFKTWVEVSQWSEYPTGEPTKEALKRTLLKDHPAAVAEFARGSYFESWHNLMTASEVEILEMLWKKLHPSKTRLFSRPPPTVSAGARRERFLRRFVGQVPEKERTFRALSAASASGFHFRALPFSDKKCFFRTEKGYFGTAPDPLPTKVEVGDKIAIVAGLEMPLLLRPVEDGYRLLTHIYVHGIMHGEAWPQRENDLEEIVLV